MVAVQSPAVQTFLARRAVSALKDKIDGDITFSKLHVRPFDAVVLQDVVITDRHPFRPDSAAPVDTFFRAGHISANFSLRGLFNGEGFHVGRARIMDAAMNLVTEPDPSDTSETVMNLSRIFGLTSSDEVKEDSGKNIFDIRKIEIANFRFRMVNMAAPIPSQEGLINWKDLDISDINAKGRNIRMKGKVLSAIADDISFKEKSGYAANHVSGECEVGNGKAILKKVVLEDPWSYIDLPEFTMTYPDGFSDFIHGVRMDAEVDRTTLDFKSLGYFAAALGKMDMKALIDGEFHGYVDDFRLDGFDIAADGLKARLDGKLTGLPEMGSMMLDTRLTDAEFTTEGLSGFIRGFAPQTELPLGKFAKGENIVFNGTAVGPINRLKINGEAITDNSGSFNADIDLRNLTDASRDMEIAGLVATRSLDLGRILGNKQLGECTIDTRVAASLGGGKTSISVDSLVVDRLTFNGYSYSEIRGNLAMNGKNMSADLVSGDPNLSMRLTGKAEPAPTGDGKTAYKVDLDIKKADLQALNLYKNGLATVSLTAAADIIKGDDEKFSGKADISDLRLSDDRGHHDFGDIRIAGNVGEDLSMLSLDSDFARASYKGSAFIPDFIRDIKKISVERELPVLFKGDGSAWSGNDYSVDLGVRKVNDILGFFLPGIYVADSTSVRLDVDSEGRLAGTISSGRLALKDKYLKDVRIGIDNDNGQLWLNLNAKEISVSPILMKDNNLQAFANDDGFALGLTFDNGTELANKGQIYLGGDLRRDESDSLAVDGQILPSKLWLNSELWTIEPADVSFAGGRLYVDKLRMSSIGQSLVVDGGYSARQEDSLSLDLNRFSLGIINSIMPRSYGIQGFATGKAQLFSPMGENKKILLNLHVDSTAVSGHRLGTLTLASNWDNEIDGFAASLSNDLDGQNTLKASGFYSTAKKEVLGDVKLTSFDLGIAEPFLTSVMSQLEGQLSGNVRISGSLDNPDISGTGLNLEDALMKIAFTNVAYKVSGPLHLDNDGVWFDDISIRDRYDNGGVLGGSLGWNRLKDMNMNAKIRFDRMEVLDIRESADAAFYGHVFATGDLGINGPFSALELDVRANTAKNGEFHIPLGGNATAGNSDLLVFKEEADNIYLDPYELMMNAGNSAEEKKASGDLGIKLWIGINPQTTAYLEIDKESGNVLTGRGQGDIEVNVRPSRGLFTLGGNYNITSGNYHLDVLGVANRDFEIQDGSSVKFNGDIMDSELDINALYSLKTNIGTLIADTTSNTRRTVNCGISITDRLKSPRIGFSIDVPDLDPSTKALVESALNNEDKVQKQLLSLLISGSFLPDESGGIVNNTDMLASSVTEIMSQQLNNILQKLDIPIDLGLDYQSTSSGSSIYDVAVSTALFNDRVIVNGTIGNRQYASGGNTNEVVGDLDIEIKLDRPGSVRLNLFSHSADQYTSYLDNSQRNGVGITYQRDFNSFREFIRRLFTHRDRRQEEDARMRLEGQEQEMKVIHVEPVDYIDR